MFAGPRAKTDRRWLWFSLPASALAVGLVLQVIDVAEDNLAYNNRSASQQVAAAQPYENIYAYDENGKLLTNVLLYDEDGNPINAPRQYYGCAASDPQPMIPANRYPRPKIDYENGTCYTVEPSVSAPSSTESTPPSSSDVAPSSSVSPTSVSPSK